MQIEFSKLNASQIYHVMTQVIVPRPIAWVLSDNGIKENGNSENGIDDDSSKFNLAPFSYFNAICSDPPLIVLSIGHKPNGDKKDTRRNIVERSHAVIHIPSVGAAQAVTASAATLEHGDSELNHCKLETVNVDGWPLPRLRDSRIAMLCKLYDEANIGPNQQGVLFCEIESVYIADSIVEQDAKDRLKVRADLLEPLSRLGASEYADFGQVFKLNRPK